MALTLAAGALLAASCVYAAAVARAVARFARRPEADSVGREELPPVSLLKPAVEAGPEFASLLRSHAAQDYPELEILAGVREGDREALAAVQQVRSEFPSLRIEPVECPGPSSSSNGKVEALERLARAARHAVLVISDADIRVPAGWLGTVSSELAAPGTGLVTCLYRAEPCSGLASRLEAQWINTEFASRVMLADWLQEIRFALGATIAVRTSTLGAAGGLEPLRRFVGDDFQLGQRVAATGHQVRISSVTVTTHLQPSGGWRDAWKRQLRWARTIRKQRPWGYAGLLTSFGTLWAGIGLAVRADLLWPLATTVLLLKLMTAFAAAKAVGSDRSRRDWWLAPAVDLGGFAVWLWSYFGRSVTWAGQRLRLGRHGRIL